ncbi:hypothetical protein PAHAL_2G434800 [Panicum hallii]|jgi:hypothetical protein|uniref:TFIIS N-terminal domain-containing protein n=1 Tax=Panicum hallii TaxID=206008 RepID=A0A2T8KSJ4_9POAL|nr:hypothetical protein PAHAL_2G434800 [Panicum hallii]
MALRRWKSFLGAFPHIDTAIEAADADGLLSRDEIRSARSRIVEMLCDAADNDDEKAEGFCVLLDKAMAASLATLRAVPSERIALASDDLVGAVGALMRDHASERVRGLARDVVRGWRAGVKAKLARARAAMDVLDGLSSTPPPPHQDSDTKAKKIPEKQPRPRKTAVVSSCRVSTAESYGPLPKNRSPVVRTSNVKPSSANTGAPAVVPVPAQPKMTPPVVACSVAVEKNMEATKRKLHEEAEDAKRQRTIEVIRPPRPPTGQRQRNAHPAVRARAPAGELRVVRGSSSCM